jgi:hypothetical protein
MGIADLTRNEGRHSACSTHTKRYGTCFHILSALRKAQKERARHGTGFPAPLPHHARVKKKEFENALYHSLDVPDEGAEAELVCVFVHPVQGVQERVYFLIVHDCYDGGVHCRPGVTAVVRVAFAGAAALYLLYARKTPAVHPVEQRDDLLVMGLVKSYQY